MCFEHVFETSAFHGPSLGASGHSVCYYLFSLIQRNKGHPYSFCAEGFPCSHLSVVTMMPQAGTNHSPILQMGKVTCLRSHDRSVPKPGFKADCLTPSQGSGPSDDMACVCGTDLGFRKASGRPFPDSSQLPRVGVGVGIVLLLGN